MRQYVKLWIKTCLVCGARKRPGKHAKASLGGYVVGSPMDRIATDITGPFPFTDSGSRYILVVQDQFSKWVEAYPIKDQSADVLVYEFFSRFGSPIELHSDQGSN